MSISFLLTSLFNVSKNSSQKWFVPPSLVIPLKIHDVANNLCLIFVCNLDITFGAENVQVSSVNSIDSSNPPIVFYTTKYIPQKSVDINTEPEFLVCCDCTDDCQDKTKCQCWQLTIKV